MFDKISSQHQHIQPLLQTLPLILDILELVLNHQNHLFKLLDLI